MTEVRTEFQGGTYTTSWQSASVEWANCQVNTKGYFNTRENHDLQKKQQFSQWDLKLRADVVVTNKNRIIFHDGSTDRILTVETTANPTARGRMLEVKCREEEP
jgi:head-tail adaptor